jgi:hypothetical protein
MIGPVHVGSFVVGMVALVAINYFFFNLPSRVKPVSGSN